MSVSTTERLTASSIWSNGAEYTDGFRVLSCYSCTVVFAMTETMYDSRRSDGANFYCPNGHSQHFVETDSVRLRKEREARERERVRLLRQLDNAIDDAQAQRRTAAAIKGHLTRARNRAAAGVCPAPGCKRSFDKLAEHVRTEHPDMLNTLSE